MAVAATHEGGAVSALTTSMTSRQPAHRHDRHRRGPPRLPAGFHHPTYVIWTPAGRRAERIEPPSPVLGTGLGNEAAHVQDCLRDGLSESPLVPRAQTLELLDVMDEIRRQIGVRYAADGSGDPTDG